MAVHGQHMHYHSLLSCDDVYGDQIHEPTQFQLWQQNEELKREKAYRSHVCTELVKVILLCLALTIFAIGAWYLVKKIGL
jgi:hypothetical protein